MIVENLMQIQIPDRYNAGAILISTILNAILGMLWYGPLFGKFWMQLVTEDKSILPPKGKKEMSMEAFAEAVQNRWPYPDHYSYIASMLCNVLKAFFFVHWLTVLGTESLKDALLLALSFSLIHAVSVHQYFWQGRKMTLAAIDYGYETTGLVLTSIAVSQIPSVLSSAF